MLTCFINKILNRKEKGNSFYEDDLKLILLICSPLGNTAKLNWSDNWKFKWKSNIIFQHNDKDADLSKEAVSFNAKNYTSFF